MNYTISTSENQSAPCIIHFYNYDITFYFSTWLKDSNLKYNRFFQLLIYTNILLFVTCLEPDYNHGL